MSSKPPCAWACSYTCYCATDNNETNNAQVRLTCVVTLRWKLYNIFFWSQTHHCSIIPQQKAMIESTCHRHCIYIFYALASCIRYNKWYILDLIISWCNYTTLILSHSQPSISSVEILSYEKVTETLKHNFNVLPFHWLYIVNDLICSEPMPKRKICQMYI